MHPTTLSNMAACIVCNQETLPDDVKDVSDMAGLCARLEKVLDEAVPVDAVMCSSCQCDLSQIEMYYALLTVFKKRYSETAKRRLQSLEGETSRNILQESADPGSTENLLGGIFGSGDQSSSSSRYLPLYTNITTKDGRPEISVPSELVGVQAVKEEADTSLPEDSANTNIDELVQPIPYPFPTGVIAHKKRGRPRKFDKSKSVSTSSLVAYPKKRGRPRKTEPSASVGSGASATHAKKRGKPRRSDSSRDSSGSADTQPGEWEAETCMAEETETTEVKLEAAEPSPDSPSLGNALVVVESTVSNTKHRKSLKNQNLSGNNSAHKPAARRKQRRPRRIEHRPQASLACPVCNKVLIDKHRLQEHMKSHSDERPHMCSICGKGFKLKNNLYGHMKIHTAEKSFKCEVCGKAFIRKTYLERHSLVHLDSLPFPCDQCDKRFKSQDRLKVHIKLAHVQGRKFLCNICGLAMYTAGNLRVHILTHSDVKPFQCKTCGKGCSTKQTLKNHELSHTEEGRVKQLCPICGKSFSNKSYLATHMIVHTGQSKHFCTVCNKSIISGSAYRTHMLIHQDHKPHQCTECGKNFRIKIHLKQHMMSHSDERPFKCPCGQAFRQKSKLERHTRTKVHAEFEAKSNPAHMGNVPVTVNRPLEVQVLPGFLPQVLPASLPLGPSEPIAAAPLPIAPPLPLGIGDMQQMALAYQSDPVVCSMNQTTNNYL